MSYSLINAAFKAEIPQARKFVLVALCNYANDAGECFPSIPQLMAQCSMTDRGVQRCIVQLVADGYLKRDFRKGRSTVYVVTDPRTWVTPTECHPDQESPRVRHKVAPDTGSSPTECHPHPDSGSGDPDTGSPITTTYPPPNHQGVSVGADAENQPTPVAAACMAMIAAGIPASRVSFNHPLLHELVDAGHLPQEFGRAAAYAIELGKDFAYALGIVKRQARDAPRTTTAPTVFKPRPNDPIRGKSYVGTAIEQLAPEFQTALSGLAGAG